MCVFSCVCKGLELQRHGWHVGPRGDDDETTTMTMLLLLLLLLMMMIIIIMDIFMNISERRGEMYGLFPSTYNLDVN